MSQITIFYGAGPSAGSAGSPMLHKPCFISLRTQITGGALLLLIAWLVTQGLWLYPEIKQQKERQQREFSEQTLTQLSWDSMRHIEKLLQDTPESEWRENQETSSAWLSQHHVLRIEWRKQPKGDANTYTQATSDGLNITYPEQSPRLSCLGSCALWFSVFKHQSGSVDELLVQSSLEPLLTQLSAQGIIAVIQPKRMAEQLESTLSAFLQAAPDSGQNRSISAISPSVKAAVQPAPPVLDGNRLSYQGQRYQIWERQLTGSPHSLAPATDSAAWAVFFTPEPSVSIGELLERMTHSWSLIFPLLLLLLAAVIDATWGKRVRNLQARFGAEAPAQTTTTGGICDEITTIKSHVTTLILQLAEKESTLDTQSSELRQQTLLDPLTGLYNRQCFMFELNRVIANQQRNSSLLSLILLDVNEFKRINTVLGLQQGDLLLQQLAQRMRHLLRESDLLCRFNGDLFAILTSDIQHKENIHILMSKLLSQLQQPLELGATQHRLQFSAGIVLIQKCFSSVSELLTQAEIALQEAKSQGHNRYQLFTPSLLEKSVRHCFIAKQFPQALLSGQLSLHFQPIYDLARGSIVGLEAFTRWHHPQEGYITPSEFIPILEESTLSLTWGDWVLEQALGQLYQLDRIGHAGLQITINLTTQQLFAPSLPQVLARLTLAYHIMPNRIILELNEAPLICDYKQAHALMLSLHEAGYLLSLDNFGTGYSALSYLHRLPFDYIKLASAFTLKMIDSDIDRQLVGSILQLSHAQGKKVVGERVENALQSSLLQELGCDQLQGYLISHPLSECDLASQLSALACKFSKQSHARHHP